MATIKQYCVYKSIGYLLRKSRSSYEFQTISISRAVALAEKKSKNRERE